MTNEIIPHEPEKDVSYAEEKLLMLLDKSLQRMEKLDELCEEMDSDVL